MTAESAMARALRKILIGAAIAAGVIWVITLVIITAGGKLFGIL